jgi:hypothetical protein
MILLGEAAGSSAMVRDKKCAISKFWSRDMF